MKNWAVSSSGLLVLALGLAIYALDLPLFRAISNQARDALIVQLAKPPQTDRIVIVDIDETSLRRLGQWPWPRHVLASLVDRLREAGASVVAFDVVFPEVDRSSPGIMLDDWRAYFNAPLELSGSDGIADSFDDVFAASLRQMPTILAVYGRFTHNEVDATAVTDDPLYRGYYIEKGAKDRHWLPQVSSVLTPVDRLYKAATSTGFINTAPDSDNIIRRTPLVFAYGPQRVYPSLSLEALRLFTGHAQYRIEYDDQGAEGVKYLGLRERLIPTDGHGRLVINYRSASFPRFSVTDVLDGRVAAERLQGSVVFIGTSAAGLNDLVGTPVQSEFPGVEVHATALDNMLAGDILREPRWAFTVNFLTTAVVGILLVLVIARARAAWSAMYTLIFAGTAVAASFVLAREFHLVLVPAESVVTLLAVYSVVTVVKYRQEENERKRIRSMFGTMVSSDVLNYLEKNPDSFSLAGRRMDCTVFFSDIVAFTPVAERMAPEQLSALLNAYMTPMTGIIMRHGGYVDKFNGDSIMAVWGVPFPSNDHAERACRAALEQIAKLAGLNPVLQERFGVTFNIRIGINTGTVTAGNMGSFDRFQYTVLGDTVNVASRLEGLGKAYGTNIIISESTRERLPADIRTRQIDHVTVAGKAKAVLVHELLT